MTGGGRFGTNTRRPPTNANANTNLQKNTEPPDAITDCFVDEEPIPHWAGGGTGHGAMVRSAILILKELGEGDGEG